MWCWGAERDDIYSVKDACVMLACRNCHPTPHRPIVESLTYVWKAAATMKARVSAWRLLWNRLPTKDNVSNRITLDDEDKKCVICGNARESMFHVFLECEEVVRI